MEWIYLPEEQKDKLIDRQLYLCNGDIIDLYTENAGWVLKHPGEEYIAVIPIGESDIGEWFEGIPPKHGKYIVKREGINTLWIDTYGVQFFDNNRVGWSNDLVPTLKWGEIPFLDTLCLSETRKMFKGE